MHALLQCPASIGCAQIRNTVSHPAGILRKKLSTHHPFARTFVSTQQPMVWQALGAGLFPQGVVEHGCWAAMPATKHARITINLDMLISKPIFKTRSQLPQIRPPSNSICNLKPWLFASLVFNQPLQFLLSVFVLECELC